MKDSKTGRFQPTPKGQKTPKMIEVEKRLGRTLEEDFQECHIEKQWGQKRIADRWDVPRGLIFHSNHRIRSQSWVAKLNLPVRRDLIGSTSSNRTGLRCEICGDATVNPHRAHWIADKDGGSTQRFNILRLCPNHHQLLDAGDAATTERAQEILLFRESKRIIEQGRDRPAKQKDLVAVCRAIITRKLS